MTSDVQHLRRNIMVDPYNSVVFQVGSGLEIYVVGGYLRDLLAGRRSRDRDYVVEGPMEGLVKEVTRATDGTLIELGGKGLCRIVVKNGETLDFTPLRGDIEKDLACRDFTINSIAWSPRTGWIDPKGGIDDLDRGLLRMVDERNLRSDPLRILRAYRFAGEFSFEIEPATRTALRKLSSLISSTASERITSEFFKILNLKSASHTVEMILRDGLLPRMISSPYRDLDRQVKGLHKLNRRSSQASLKYRFEVIFSQGLTYRGLLGLEVLLEGLPVHLFALSGKITRRMIHLKRASEVLEAASLSSSSREVLFEIFEIAGEAAPEFLLIRDLMAYVDALEEYERIQKEGLLTAEEVRSAIGIETGPALGNSIRAVKKAEFTGRISTAEEALDFLRELTY
jgi:tRNA nucleotidyltransferase/poly(A) polymerase